jgi:predicted glutamine amidotransferase
MCELFAMSSRAPATVSLSLEEFARHGGGSGPHRDGWGIAWYDELDARLVREPFAAANSVCVKLLQRHPFESQLVISHVRFATQGSLALKNTQPFARELRGRMHVFAHNGDLSGVRSRPELALGSFWPVGDTDSEHAFCALLERMRGLWRAPEPPPSEARLQIVAKFAADIRPLGPANFIYSDGELLFVHRDRRTHERGAPPRAPGLYVLSRRCTGGARTLANVGMQIDSPGEQEVVLAASVPLTEEDWRPLGDGEIVVARAGARI